MDQTLNYSRQIVDFFTSEKFIPFQNSPESGCIFDLVELLDQSVKFILPERGEILESISNEFKRDWIDLMFMPYPISAFEIPFNYDGLEVEQVDGLAHQIEAPKRVALCWNPKDPNPTIQRINKIIANYDVFKLSENYIIGDPDTYDGFCMVVFFYDNRDKEWKHTAAGAFYPYDINVDSDQIGLAGRPINVFPDLLQYHYIYQHNGNRETLLQQIWHDISYETWCVLQACCVLNCENISTRDIVPPAKIQKHRVKNKQAPLYIYKTLEIKATGVGYDSQNSASGSGSSKKTHLRRGHLRRLQSKKVIWVKSAIVGAANQNKGQIHKDYAIKSSN